MLSTQDIQNLLNQQQTLDDFIYSTNNTTASATIDDRFLALFVEIAECLNENKSFKYWAPNHIKNDQKALEEYVDCLHFILSLVLTLNIDIKKFIFKKVENKSSLTILTLQLFDHLNDWQKIRNDKYFFEFFNTFAFIGTILKFKPKAILAMYKHKNEINHQRQLKNG